MSGILYSINVDEYTNSGSMEITNGWCHQCKMKQTKLYSCVNLWKSKKENKCNGKYCGRCIEKHYNENMEELKNNSNWTCYSCQKVCVCAACKRKRGEPVAKRKPPCTKGQKKKQKSIGHYPPQISFNPFISPSYHHNNNNEPKNLNGGNNNFEENEEFSFSYPPLFQNNNQHFVHMHPNSSFNSNLIPITQREFDQKFINNNGTYVHNFHDNGYSKELNNNKNIQLNQQESNNISPMKNFLLKQYSLPIFPSILHEQYSTNNNNNSNNNNYNDDIETNEESPNLNMKSLKSSISFIINENDDEISYRQNSYNPSSQENDSYNDYKQSHENKDNHCNDLIFFSNQCLMYSKK
eukprot:TRINITY_DN2840_c0_g1_i1.p1 TRINITY_DN2840_c0_g1~~TRINITY_DN2840_c0_g1_i1.p1  ORF type:complete len:352 (+),score=71.86 TRINITY_DN2840_c0_g1_i1:82-1137(+)